MNGEKTMTDSGRPGGIGDAASINTQKSGRSLEPTSSLDKGLEDQLGRHLGQISAEAIDFAFLKAQTFNDTALEGDVLELFMGQARKVLPTLPGLTAKGQADTAHLLKGSARGIGAWAAAAAAEDYEAAAPDLRHVALPALVEAFAAVEIAIEGRLAALRR